MDFDTVVIGGGQAGLTMSHALMLRGRPHVVLERARIRPTLLAEVDDMAMLRLLAREREGVTLAPPPALKEIVLPGPELVTESRNRTTT